MAASGRKIDLTVRLPDELLHQVFSYLSLRDKLRVESVSHRFQRCVLELLEMQPQPLELKGQDNRLLNGYKVQSEGWMYDDALRSLSNKSKFSDVRISLSCSNERMNTLLSILLESDCLDKVQSFECDFGPSQDMLKMFFDKCVKLSNVKLDFVVGDGSHRMAAVYEDVLFHVWTSLDTIAEKSVVLNLSSILDTKALTQLDLQLFGYSHKQLVELFRSLKPQTLRKLRLWFCSMPALDLAEIVNELSTSAWAALEEMEICWREDARVYLDEFFDSFTLLAALKKCHIELYRCQIWPDDQFTDAMGSLFKSAVKITLSSDGCLLSYGGFIHICEIIAQIRQVQNAHQNMGVDFGAREESICYITLSLDNGVFEEVMSSIIDRCHDAQCLDCPHFYPKVLHVLKDLARKRKDAHLMFYQLDKCRIESVVEHLNTWLGSCRALAAEMNGAQDLVTIAFETEDQPIHQYKITVGCAPCLSHCIRCIDI